MTLDAFVRKYRHEGLSIVELAGLVADKLGSEDICMTAKDALIALAELDAWAEEQGVNVIL